MALLNKLVAASLIAAGCQGCSPSPANDSAGARPDFGPVAPAAALAESGRPGEPTAVGPARSAALPVIPQYRRTAPPASGVVMDIGLMGTVRIRDGCILVVDKSGASVLPVFPMGAEWTIPGKALRTDGRIVRDGERVVWSVEQTERSFRQGRPLQPGEQDIPDQCTASRYVLLV